MRLFRSSTYSPRSLRMIALAGMCLFPGLSLTADEGDLSKYLNKQSFDVIAELLNKGDLAYKRDNMKVAVQEYSSARKEASSKILPPRFKQAVEERYAQALAQLAHQEARAGKMDSAEKMIEEAYTLAPQAPGVKKVKLQLADTIRFNPAASDEHAKDVVDVKGLLEKAFGSYDLGDYDKADQYFESVLKIDPTNSSARRGMEKVEQGRQNYYNAAYDQTRSEMLNQVSAAWEKPVPLELGDIPDHSQSAPDNAAQSGMAGKLNSLIIDNVNLEDVNLLEAIDFVRRQARRVDTAANEVDRGVNIIADVGTANDPAAKAAMERRFNVKLRNAPLSEVLRYIAEMSGTQVRVTPYATKLVLSNENAGDVLMRTFKVSPDFFSSSGNVQQESGDPFSAGDSASSGLKVRHANPVEFFKNSGIQFPAGTSAQYSAGSSSLMVRNTPANLNLIEDLIAAKQAEKPAQVVIKTTIIEVSRRELHELGFDWVISPISLGGNANRYIGGGTEGSGGDVYDNMGYSTGNHPLRHNGVVTAGLRSGDDAFPDNSLDSIIAAGIDRMNQQQVRRRAPGIISARAVFSNGDISVIMRGLNQNKNIDTLQQPQIIARSGEKASFSHIREFIYPTDYTEPQLPSSIGTDNGYRRRSTTIIDGVVTNQGGGSSSPTTFPVTPSHPTSFTTKPVGVTLEVEPTISEDRTMVELQLVPTMVDFDGFVNYGSPIKTSMVTPDTEKGISSVTLSQNAILMPVFSKKSMETKVTIANGYTVVLGGLIKSKKEKFEDKVPVLGDIPYFGRLFRSEGEKTEEKVLIIMVRADVVDPSGQNVRSLTPDDPS